MQHHYRPSIVTFDRGNFNMWHNPHYFFRFIFGATSRFPPKGVILCLVQSGLKAINWLIILLVNIIDYFIWFTIFFQLYVLFIFLIYYSNWSNKALHFLYILNRMPPEGKFVYVLVSADLIKTILLCQRKLEAVRDVLLGKNGLAQAWNAEEVAH